MKVKQKWFTEMRFCLIQYTYRMLIIVLLRQKNDINITLRVNPVEKLLKLI